MATARAYDDTMYHHECQISALGHEERNTVLRYHVYILERKAEIEQAMPGINNCSMSDILHV